MDENKDTPVGSVQLTNGKTLHKLDGRWPAFQKACPTIDHACEVCPIRQYCGDNNEFDCRVYEMFSGFYLEDEYLDVFDNQWDRDEAIRRSGAAIT